MKNCGRRPRTRSCHQSVHHTSTFSHRTTTAFAVAAVVGSVLQRMRNVSFCYSAFALRPDIPRTLLLIHTKIIRIHYPVACTLAHTYNFRIAIFVFALRTLSVFFYFFGFAPEAAVTATHSRLLLRCLSLFSHAFSSFLHIFECRACVWVCESAYLLLEFDFAPFGRVMKAARVICAPPLLVRVHMLCMLHNYTLHMAS